MSNAEALRWQEAALAAALLAIDPDGIRGAVLRGAPSLARDAWIALLRGYLPAAAPCRRVPAQIGDERLLGGLDLAATLRAGKPVAARGLLCDAHGGLVLLAMAERLPVGTAARIAAVLDEGVVTLQRDGMTGREPARFAAVALDEGIDADEHPPSVLLDRLAFHMELDDMHRHALGADAPQAQAVASARARLHRVEVSGQMSAAMCATAAALGIASLRAPLLALRVARAAAALDARTQVDEEDVMLAARLVLAARATRLPVSQDQDSEEPQSPPPPRDDGATNDSDAARPEGPVEDRVLAAAQAAIPAGLLLQFQSSGRTRSQGQAGRAGALRRSTTRGRPAGTVKGDPRAGVRLSVIDTLRAAAPWQALRRREAAHTAIGARVAIRREDFRVRRFHQRSATTTIFVVDASGSSALHRLAEAKGAVELLLAECYVRRDNVAMIAFRGSDAELILPPTRSLVRAKRSLAGLPGGGGTPLAQGLEAALALAEGVRRKGDTPVIVLLTDGRANVARDGTHGRVRAEHDTLTAARLLRSAGLTSVLVDTSPRPQTQAERLAREMGARYLPLPHADAALLSSAVKMASA